MSEQLTAWAQAHPQAIVVALVATGVFLLVRHARSGFVPQIDPVRLFTAEQKTEAMKRCGSRCEGESFPFVRCSRRASQGDHWYPHSLGGVTSEQNLVMLCGSCNRSKSAKIPTVAQTARLDWRRRRYAPGLGRPGERYR